MNKKLAIVQSNYIPWKGYFDLINSVDEFVLFDDMLYTKNDWRNRNKIKTPNGLMWLTIPVRIKGRCRNRQKISETIISNPRWKYKHWRAIVLNYSKARYFKVYKEFFEELYLNCHETRLSQINYRFIRAICDILGIQTRLSWSMDYFLIDGKTERLVDLCKQARATEYVSGPAAKAYIDELLFKAENITLQYMDYSGYPKYKQLVPPFEHHVSIIDLIFNVGPNAPKYMQSF